MNKSNIEYLTHSWPVITGCSQPPSVCAVREKCWARAWHRRFKERMADHYNVDFSPHVNIDLLTDPLRLQKPARIGVGFTGDIGCINPEWTFIGAEGPVPFRQWLFTVINSCNHPRQQFFFLTKSPEKLITWGTWPDNAWVGMTETDATRLALALGTMTDIQARHKWISFEPLLDWTERPLVVNDLAEMMRDAGIEWVVLGGLNRGQPQPKPEWIRDIVEACDQVGVKVWLKRNLQQVLMPYIAANNGIWTLPPKGHMLHLRQELP